MDFCSFNKYKYIYINDNKFIPFYEILLLFDICYIQVTYILSLNPAFHCYKTMTRIYSTFLFIVV